MMENSSASSIQTGQRRSKHQLILGPKAATAQAVVSHMGMVQAQDYLGALWAVGLRMEQATEETIEEALADKQIVRTWPARGTLHFVAAEDVHWMLGLLAERTVNSRNGRFRRLELDEAVFKKSRAVLTRALAGGQRLGREELFQLLEAKQISTAGQRGIHILWKLAQEGLLCFGPRQGKQQTFVLLEEWIPRGNSKTREEGLAELARRYFTSHGPATLEDFSWWSGLTKNKAKLALELNGRRLATETWGGFKRWYFESSGRLTSNGRSVQLLPAFDEYLVGYQNRDDVLDPSWVKQINAGGGMLSPVIVMDGQVCGTWKRILKKDRVNVQPNWINPAKASDLDAFERAVWRYAQFLKRNPVIE
jgi:hypothetical protein